MFSADITFITEDIPHEYFTREGNDLIMVCNISLLDALLGTVITVYTLDDRIFRVPITDIIS